MYAGPARWRRRRTGRWRMSWWRISPCAARCWIALLEGFAWGHRGAAATETLPDDVQDYAARVAGTVGAMMAVLMGARSPEAVARACDLGVAMQFSNIARDVGEDARAGRIYLPLRWLAEAGIDPEAFLASPRAERGACGRGRAPALPRRGAVCARGRRHRQPAFLVPSGHRRRAATLCRDRRASRPQRPRLHHLEGARDGRPQGGARLGQPVRRDPVARLAPRPRGLRRSPPFARWLPPSRPPPPRRPGSWPCRAGRSGCHGLITLFSELDRRQARG